MFQFFYVHSCFTAFPCHWYSMKTEILPRSDRLPTKLTTFPNRNLESLFNGTTTVTGKNRDVVSKKRRTGKEKGWRRRNRSWRIRKRRRRRSSMEWWRKIKGPKRRADGKDFLVLTMKHIGWVALYLQSFIISALMEVSRQLHAPTDLPLKRNLLPIY